MKPLRPASVTTESVGPGLFKVLVIEDDRSYRDIVAQTLSAAGFEVHAYANAEPALAGMRQVQPHVVLTDLYLEGATGLQVLARVKDFDEGLPVVLMTAQGDIRTAIDAMKNGAYDFLEKPFRGDEAIVILHRAAQNRQLVLENRALKDKLAFASGLERVLVGRGDRMRQLRDTLLKVAPTPANVILLGETGAGKELVARCLHEFSGRQGKFVAINCAAVPETLFESELFGHEAGAFTGAAKQRIGKFEYANNGTLLLDEIEAMPLHLQVKILRALQEREIERLGSNRPIPINVRVVAATKVDLKDVSEQGRFRADLYYRLNVASLHIPALRERREDVPELFMHFVREVAMRIGQQPVELDAELQQKLMAYDWPGNVRELRNAAEQHQFGIPVMIGSTAVRETHSLEGMMGVIEKSIIENALTRNGGNANAACDDLQINYSLLYRRMKQYGMDLSNFRRPDTPA